MQDEIAPQGVGTGRNGSVTDACAAIDHGLLHEQKYLLDGLFYRAHHRLTDHRLLIDRTPGHAMGVAIHALNVHRKMNVPSRGLRVEYRL